MAIDLFAEFATDTNAEVNGIYVPYKGVEFLIARAGNRKYGRALSEAVTKNQIKLDLKDDAADALSDKLMAEVLAKTILLGWKGEINFKGEPLAYSYENAVKVLMLADFRVLISKLADDRAAFRDQSMDDKVKN
jgi:hypothetical protein